MSTHTGVHHTDTVNLMSTRTGVQHTDTVNLMSTRTGVHYTDTVNLMSTRTGVHYTDTFNPRRLAYQWAGRERRRRHRYLRAVGVQVDI